MGEQIPFSVPQGDWIPGALSIAGQVLSDMDEVVTNDRIDGYGYVPALSDWQSINCERPYLMTNGMRIEVSSTVCMVASKRAPKDER